MEDKDFWLDTEREIEKELEACRNCAYNDCGSCSCYEYEYHQLLEEANRHGHDIGSKLIDVQIING